MRKLFSIAVTSLMVSAMPAVAGPYAGVTAGVGSRSVYNYSISGGGPERYRDESNTLDFGAFAGYEAAIGNRFVVAAEAEFGSSTAKLRLSVPGGTIETNPSWYYSVSAKPGVRISERIAAYGIIGFGAERTRDKIIIDPAVADQFPSGTYRSSRTSDGFNYGAGISASLAERVVGRIEYRHRDFDDDYSPEQLMLGVAYRF